MFISTDNGANWAGVYGFTSQTIVALAASGSTIFAGSSEGGVFRSIDNGANWTAVNTGLAAHNVLALAVNGSNIFVGTSGGVFFSTNNGASWIPGNTGLTDLRVLEFTVGGRDLFAGTLGAAYGVAGCRISPLTLRMVLKRRRQTFHSAKTTPTPLTHRPKSASRQVNLSKP
ncbi:MAG: WD40/YVTN/BNR-like repeat-containing protein [bacterium]